jgi:ankyrin repeat protein
VLYFAVVHGERAIADMLLAAGAGVNAGDGMMTPLHAAAAFDQPEMARWLLDRGARADVANYDGQTPLELAQANGYLRVVDVLISAHAG